MIERTLGKKYVEKKTKNLKREKEKEREDPAETVRGKRENLMTQGESGEKQRKSERKKREIIRTDRRIQPRESLERKKKKEKELEWAKNKNVEREI